MKKYYANNSYYQYYMIMAGVAFGIFELDLLKYEHILDARVWIPALVSSVFPVHLAVKKRRLENANVETITLTRRYRHIFADYLCAVGLTSFFSILAFVIMNNRDFFEQGWVLSPFGFAIVLNTILFTVGMVLLSAIASDERRPSNAKGCRQQTPAP